MPKYLKKFETQAAYEAAQSGLILPNVSLTVDNNTVHYNPSSPVPPTPSHDFVEIGGIKWATMNVGANSITDYGLYFQWGDVSGYTASQVGTDKVFDWANYKYSNNGSSSDMTKYNSTDGKTVLDASDDAAVVNWGGSWRMPTKDEFVALGNAVNSAWTTDYQGSGVSGLELTDKTDNTKVLFFPAAGNCNGSSVDNVGIYSGYWTSTHSDYYVDKAHGLFSGISYVFWNNSSNRYYGYPVRGVLDDSNS